jgi:hypothetical protein
VNDHPRFGRYLVDTRVETTMKDNPEKSPIGGFFSRFLHMVEDSPPCSPANAGF